MYHINDFSLQNYKKKTQLTGKNSALSVIFLNFASNYEKIIDLYGCHGTSDERLWRKE